MRNFYLNPQNLIILRKSPVTVEDWSEKTILFKMAANSEREIQSALSENAQAVEGESCEKETGVYFSRIKNILAQCTEKCFAPVR